MAHSLRSFAFSLTFYESSLTTRSQPRTTARVPECKLAELSTAALGLPVPTHCAWGLVLLYILYSLRSVSLRSSLHSVIALACTRAVVTPLVPRFVPPRSLRSLLFASLTFSLTFYEALSLNRFKLWGLGLIPFLKTVLASLARLRSLSPLGLALALLVRSLRSFAHSLALLRSLSLTVR